MLTLKNKITPKNHHGCRELHSTLMAAQALENICKKNKSKNKCTAILATDLRSAYDIVDHPTLLIKMEYIGIRGKPYLLIKSYLADRLSLGGTGVH